MGIDHGECHDNCGSTQCDAPHMPRIDNHGIVAFHDMACAVRYWEGRKAVYECNTGVFHPSWAAQMQGWRLVKADTWFKRLVLRLAFSEPGSQS